MFITANDGNPEMLLKSLGHFAAFRKEPPGTNMADDPNKMVTAVQDMTEADALLPYEDKLHWNSNLLSAEWNPPTVSGISSTAPDEEFVLWEGKCLSQRSPIRFRKWVHKVVKPHEEPLAVLFHVLKQMKVIEGHHFYEYDSLDYVLSRHVTPR